MFVFFEVEWVGIEYISIYCEIDDFTIENIGNLICFIKVGL